MSPAHTKTCTTTVRLPRTVYEELRSVVQKQKRGSSGAGSLNDLIVSAVKAYLKLYERRRIDTAFAGMAGDADYQKEAALLAEEFEYSDWEALRLELADQGGETLDATNFSG